jgi:hypothetical protein
MKDHPMMHHGFEAVANAIARKENIPIERADAILASKSRNASAAAKRANPNLKKVKG